MSDEDTYHCIGCIHVQHVDELPIEVAETRAFQSDSDSMLSAGERTDLCLHLALNPECGDLITGTGGVRKVRWGGLGKGKRGGYRIIYYYRDNEMPIFLLAIYSKGEKVNVTDAEKRELRQLVRELVEEYKGRKTLRLVS